MWVGTDSVPILLVSSYSNRIRSNVWKEHFDNYGKLCGRPLSTFPAPDMGLLTFSSTTTGDVWIIPFFRILGYMLHVQYVPYIITNFGQISVSFLLLSQYLFKYSWRKTLTDNNSLSLELWLIFFLSSVLISLCYFSVFSPDFLLVGCYCSMWLYFS